jgi:hypothetical protein
MVYEMRSTLEVIGNSCDLVGSVIQLLYTASSLALDIRSAKGEGK